MANVVIARNGLSLKPLFAMTTDLLFKELTIYMIANYG